MGVEVKVVSAERVVDLRHRVLRAGLSRDTAVFAGDELKTSFHLAALEGEEVVGCLTLHWSLWEGRQAYQLRGMATAEAVRGKGVGRMLLEAAEQLMRDTGLQIAWCNARVPAVGFYEKAGWRVVSTAFDIPTAGPHVRMVKILH